MMKNAFILILLIASAGILRAQDTLSLDQTIRLALQNNYGIQAAQLDALVAQNNATAGNAGLLPRITLDGRATYNWNNSNVTFQSGDKRSVTGLSTDNQSASLSVNYPLAGIIVGLANLERLRTIAVQSEIQAIASVEQSISNLIAAYYNLARQQRALQIANETVEVSRKRLERVRTQREFGAASRLAVLNAEVNLNTDSVALLNNEIALQNARRNLLALMGDDVDRDMAVAMPVDFAGPEAMTQALDSAEARNANLRLADYNRKVADFNLKIARAAQLPNLDLNVGYNINRSFNGPIAFASNINGNGFTAGATFSWNLFNGGQVKTDIQNAEVSQKAAKARLDETWLNLQRDLKNALDNYAKGLKVIRLQEKSLLAARLNFEQTEARFKLGQANSTQYREAQLNLLQVRNNLNDLRYDTKVVEMELLRLVGELLQS